MASDAGTAESGTDPSDGGAGDTSGSSSTSDTHATSGTGGTGSESTTSGETGSDESESGTTGGEVEVDWSFDPVRGVANLDDDDENGRPDWLEWKTPEDDDLAILQLPALPDGDTVELSLTGDLDHVRVWHDGRVVVGSGQNGALTTGTLGPAGAPLSLTVEFAEYLSVATLTLARRAADGAVLDTTSTTLESAPLLTTHHLDPAERIWVVTLDDTFGSNYEMVEAMKDVLGSRLTTVDGASYQGDAWIQDEIELASSIAPGDLRIDTIIDSIRDRELDPFPEQDLVAPDFAVRTWGESSAATTFDSFGNLETTPPITVDGVSYPFGRIYYGGGSDYGPHPDLLAVLSEQGFQAPIELDTYWLCVGHVDEFSTFVPDPDAPKGFRLLLSDVPSAYALLESLNPELELPRYQADHGYGTVGEILEDNALRDLNEDLQQDHLSPLRERFIAELGVSPEDIVAVPSLFEVAPDCDGYVAALIPGVVNLAVANVPGEPIHFFLPDPFLRSDSADQASDAFISSFASSLPASVVPHWVDDWAGYHVFLGEVHCGSNTLRTPTDSWWEEDP